jgi:hypothetical protein
MPRSLLSILACSIIAPAIGTASVHAAKPIGESGSVVNRPAVRVVENAPTRWSDGGSGGVPDFTRHVMPLLSKLGCANRACHGSFQGQNGFRLSLFAHDPKLDFRELTDDDGKSRIDPQSPFKSLALLKPAGAVEHEGGELIEKGSWQYRVLYDWIASDPHFDPGKARVTIERVELSPSETRMKRTGGEPVKLKLTAWFSDGTQEDVTPLTIFSTNDETVVDVDNAGVVTGKGPGDTAVVAQYAGVVVTSQFIVPTAENVEFEYPAQNKADEFVAAKLKKVGIVPSDLADDQTFLRRVYLDVIGTLPTSDEARKFSADTSKDKRAKLIDALLERPEYAMYWATKFGDWTGNDNRFTPQPREKTGWLWHDWLRDKLSRNVPYDEMVAGFLLATTREGRSADATLEEYQTIFKKIKGGFDDGTYASRKTNDIFWKKATNGNPETLGLQSAYAFLGVRLECAQCHKHPFDQWTQDDFRGFTQFFAVVSRGTPKDMQKKLPKVDNNGYQYTEVAVQSPAQLEKVFEKGAPKLLAGPKVKFQADADPREALWRWMRAPENKYFGRAIANRLWAHYFGVGIVNPVDDLNAANPPSNPQLLDWLAADFVEHGFDLKHLHRRILNSRTYQLSWVPNDSNRLDERNFSHAIVRRMPAEVVMDAINQTTGGRDEYSNNNAPAGTKTINLALSRLRGGGPEYVLGIFGRPLRTQICDCERSVETGLAQAMYLLNDTDVNNKIAAESGRLAKLLEMESNDEKLIEELYLSTLSRKPKAEELDKAFDYVNRSESRTAGMQDVLWSLLNLREFVFIH